MQKCRLAVPHTVCAYVGCHKNYGGAEAPVPWDGGVADPLETHHSSYLLPSGIWSLALSGHVTTFCCRYSKHCLPPPRTHFSHCSRVLFFVYFLDYLCQGSCIEHASNTEHTPYYGMKNSTRIKHYKIWNLTLFPKEDHTALWMLLCQHINHQYHIWRQSNNFSHRIRVSPARVRKQNYHCKVIFHKTLSFTYKVRYWQTLAIKLERFNAIFLPSCVCYHDNSKSRRRILTKFFGGDVQIEYLITLRVISGAVYCYRSCLWRAVGRRVFVGVCVCVWVCYHDNSKLRASIFTKLGL